MATLAKDRTRLEAGTTLASGRLAVLRPIGEGGMGVVYEAFDSERKARVALKTLSRLDGGGVYRLKNEFRALTDVTHPNLVRLHELFTEGEAWFFTLELIDGEHFDHWVRPEGTLDEARLRAAWPQLVAAVTAIHGARKLHRDLKPNNVLVTPEGRVVVLDFGLAGETEPGGAGQTLVDDSVSGTPAYMSPEQAAGRPATAASDLYALGVMLFEALTGTLPFSGRVGEMFAAKQRDDAPDARERGENVPEDFAALCTRLLARRPSERPERATLEHGGGNEPAATPEVSNAARAALSVSTAPELRGRETELGKLREAFRATLAGTPVVMFVSGESGMGKTALVEAFLAELGAQGQAVVLASRCYEREHVPFKGFDVLVDELSRHMRKLAPQESAALLPREAFALARLFPVLNRVTTVADAPKKQIPDPAGSSSAGRSTPSASCSVESATASRSSRSSTISSGPISIPCASCATSCCTPSPSPRSSC